jgi:hypothetical protein
VRLPPLDSHRDAATKAFRRGKVAAVFRFIDFFSDQMSPTTCHLPPPFPSRVAALNEIAACKSSAVTNECAEAVAVRINRRADAAFVGQTLSRAHQLGSVPRQIADFSFGQLMLVRNRLAFTLWAMRFDRTRER